MQTDFSDSSLVSWSRRYALLIAIWSMPVESLAWNPHLKNHNTLNTDAVAARSNISKDMSFRKWATAHGGVYTHTDAHTPPWRMPVSRTCSCRNYAPLAFSSNKE